MHRRRPFFCLVIALLFLPAGSFLHFSASGAPLDEVRSLLADLPQSQTTCGALVVDLAAGRPLIALNENAPLLPASNQKLLVLGAAIDRFGPEGTFRTVIGRQGDNLVVIGDGDPVLGDPRLAEQRGASPLAFLDDWVRALAGAGVRSVPGDLVVDATIFDTQFVHPDWEPADLVKWYGAPVGGLNLNNNCVELTVWPGASAGSSAVWSLFPPCSAVEVVNRCTSAPGSAKATPTVGRRPGTFQLVLGGQVAKRGTLQSVSIPDPNVFAATAIREYLAAKGIAIAGRLRFARVRTASGDVPADVQILAEHRTPLPEVLQRIGVDSQNMCAEALLKRLGYEWARSNGEADPVGSWTTGRQAVRQFLDALGVEPPALVVADGSGLSRENRATAAEFVRILAYMHAHPQRDLFLDSLAGTRNGGTLRKRMAGVDGEVYAKTGYMSGVRTLSGYVQSTAGRWYAFSIMFNGFRGSSAPYNKIHQRVCQILSHLPDESPP